MEEPLWKSLDEVYHRLCSFQYGLDMSDFGSNRRPMTSTSNANYLWLLIASLDGQLNSVVL